MKYRNINKGNAKIITEAESSVINLAMLKYEAVFDFISEEPYIMNIKKRENDDVLALERILRIRKWAYKNPSISWTVFSYNREWNKSDLKAFSDFDCFVIRKVTWNRSNEAI